MEKLSTVYDETGYFLNINPEPGDIYEGCFGWVNGNLYLGDVHHAAIIARLIENETHTWESLIAAKQMWGWFTIFDISNQYVGVWWNTNRELKSSKWICELSFTTDDAKQVYGVKGKVSQSFREAFPWLSSVRMGKGIGYTSQKDYGSRARNQYMNEGDNYDDEY